MFNICFSIEVPAKEMSLLYDKADPTVMNLDFDLAVTTVSYF